jgi:hypothetical protein
MHTETPKLFNRVMGISRDMGPWGVLSVEENRYRLFLGEGGHEEKFLFLD